MKRGSFFKSLFTLIVAPSILADINIKDAVPVFALTPENSTGLFNDLQLLTPEYYKHYVEKYGDVDYLKLYNQTGILFYKKEVNL